MLGMGNLSLAQSIVFLPKCLVSIFHHCPYPPVCDVDSIVSALSALSAHVRPLTGRSVGNI